MRVKLELEDDNGNVIKILEEVESVGKMLSVTEIESFVLSLGHKLLPKTEQKILEKSQRDFVEKKRSRRRMVQEKSDFIR